MTALVLGATGLIGGEVLPQLIADPYWERVVTLGRRPMPLVDSGHEHHVIDFERLEEHAELFAVDDVFCCLGTTMKKAGSEEAFRRVDFDYPLRAAQLASQRGATQYLLVSSVGADPGSRFFYTRVKGEAEEAIKNIGFESVAIMRPSQLDGDRNEERPKEALALGALRFLQPLLVGPLRALRPTPATAVAEALVQIAQTRPSGTHIYGPQEILETALGGEHGAA